MKKIVIFDRDSFKISHPGSLGNRKLNTFNHLLQREDLWKVEGKGREGWGGEEWGERSPSNVPHTLLVNVSWCVRTIVLLLEEVLT